MFQLDRIERRILVERQITIQLIAAGASDMELPDVQDAWDAFDAALSDDSTAADVDPDKADLLLALGIRR